MNAHSPVDWKVMLEAMACGCPVAAFPVTGPVDVVSAAVTGMLDDDLAVACRGALRLDRSAVRANAVQRTWRAMAEQLLSIFVPIGVPTGGAQCRAAAATARG